MALADPTVRPTPSRNLRVAAALAAVAIGMVGLSFASVPLYALFCQVTGFGGTTQRAESNPLGTIDRIVAVRFDANIASGLPWSVVPAARVSGRIGETQVVSYRATNLSGRTVTGTAGFNVTPEIAGAYFNKIECFCFTEQTLGPGETADMAVSFFVDPGIDDDPELDSLREITLSYTFYPTDNESR